MQIPAKDFQFHLQSFLHVLHNLKICDLINLNSFFNLNWVFLNERPFLFSPPFLSLPDVWRKAGKAASVKVQMFCLFVVGIKVSANRPAAPTPQKSGGGMALAWTF